MSSSAAMQKSFLDTIILPAKRTPGNEAPCRDPARPRLPPEQDGCYVAPPARRDRKILPPEIAPYSTRCVLMPHQGEDLPAGGRSSTVSVPGAVVGRPSSRAPPRPQDGPGMA